MPMGFEMLSEQSKILAKHQMNMMMQGDAGMGMGGPGGPPPMWWFLFKKKQNGKKEC